MRQAAHFTEFLVLPMQFPPAVTRCWSARKGELRAAWVSWPQPAEATAMVEKAIAHIKKVGREKALADFDNPKGGFTDRDLYVVVYDLKGKVQVILQQPVVEGLTCQRTATGSVRAIPFPFSDRSAAMPQGRLRRSSRGE